MRLALRCNPRGTARGSAGRTAALAALALLGSALPSRCGNGRPEEALGRPAHTCLPQASEPVEAHLEAGQDCIFEASFAADTYLELRVQQLGADVAITVTGPQDLVLRVDSPNGVSGLEPVFLVTPTTGSYRFEIRAVAGRGRFRLEYLTRYPASNADRQRSEAARHYFLGEELRREGTTTSLEAALAEYRAARLLWKAIGEEEWAASTLSRISRIEEASGRLRAALSSRRLAARELRAAGDATAVCWALVKVGELHDRLGEDGLSQLAYERAVGAGRRGTRQRCTATALNDLGAFWKRRGRYDEALIAYVDALELWRRSDDEASEATTLANLGELLTATGNPQVGLELLQEASSLRESLGAPTSAAETRVLVGKALRRLDRPEEALRSMEEALRLYPRDLEAGDVAGRANTLTQLGHTLAALGRLEEARETYQEAEALYRVHGDIASLADVLLRRGWLGLLDERPAEALVELESALDLVRESGNTAAEPSALYGIARCLHALGEHARALERTREAIQGVESLLSGSGSPSFRTGILHRRYDYYGFLVQLLLETDPRSSSAEPAWEALMVSEEARARSLLSQLSDSSGLAQPRPRLSRLERKLARVEHRRFARSGITGADSSDPLRAVQLDALLRLRAQRAREQRSTEHAATLGKAALEDLADPETGVLVFMLGPLRSYAWWLTDDGLEVFDLPPRAAIEPLAYRAFDELRDPAGFPWLALRQLTEAVLRPLAGRLDRPRILLVPDGALHLIPFAALREPVEGEDRALAEEFGLRHEVSQVWSLSALERITRRAAERRPARRTLAVVADPVYTAHDPRTAHVADTRGSAVEKGSETLGFDGRFRAAGFGSLGRLTGADGEARYLESIVPEDQRLVLRGFDASRSRVLSGELEDYRHLHFATHGLLADRPDSLAGLVLSLVGSDGSEVDGLLRAREVENLSIRSELVVLGACRTALGRQLRGEGIIGLPQAFVEAGATRVLVTLWEIDDRAAQRFMEAFYQALLVDGEPPAAALQYAQRQLLESEEWSSPFYWAAFVLLGDGG